MAVKLKPVNTIIMDLGLEDRGPAHQYFAERCRDRMNARYVPEDNGTLWQTSYVDYNDCSIHYIQNYAGYQYYGQRKDGSHVVKKHSKPGTGPYWDQRMVSAEGSELLKDMEKYIKGRGNK